MFHELAACCADCFIGSKSTDRTNRAWVQVYRYLDHGNAARKCRDIQASAGYPDEVQDFADHFASMQKKRHEADYNPDYRVAKLDVQSDIAKTVTVIKAFSGVSARHKRAFSALVLLKAKR